MTNGPIKKLKKSPQLKKIKQAEKNEKAALSNVRTASLMRSGPDDPVLKKAKYHYDRRKDETKRAKAPKSRKKYENQK